MTEILERFKNITDYSDIGKREIVSEVLLEIRQLKAERDKLRRLLKRAKETFEPFPVCSDLRSMTQRLREEHTEAEAWATEKGFKEHQDKFRKLYKEIKQALKEIE